ncbi:MAG: hypothetical protein KDC46_14280 [Thermoleophilia bacterium]|nr:hypothetical protein [Thermoleophilia bacterium]
MRDAMETNMQGYDEHVEYHEEEHDQVGTVEVQILLSWFFESSSPNDVAINMPRAA